MKIFRRLAALLLLAASSVFGQSATKPFTIHVNAASGGGGGQFAQGWTTSANTQYQPLCPNASGGRPDVQGASGCAYVMNAWSGGANDTLRNCLVFWGGGHHDYFGNEIYQYCPVAGTIKRLALASDASGINIASDVETMPDGTAASRHTYGGIAYWPPGDQMVIEGGGLIGPGDLGREMWTLNLSCLNAATTAVGCWTHIHPTITGGGGQFATNFGNLLLYDPTTQTMWLWESNSATSAGLWQSNSNLTTFTNKAVLNGAITGYQQGAVDTFRQRLWAIGNGKIMWVSIAPGSTFTVTDNFGTSTGCGGGAAPSQPYPGVAFDKSDNKIAVYLGQGNDVTVYNPDTNTCTLETASGGPGAPSSGNNGILGRFMYNDNLGVFEECNSWTNNCEVFRRTVDVPNQLTTIQLTATTTATLPFTVGMGFKKGDIPTGSSAVLEGTSTQQTVIKSTWNDGSAKTAIISGRVALTANTPQTFKIMAAQPVSGTAKTCTNIQTAAPSASVQIGAIGTINLSSLLASPFRTWVSGAEMVECHYRSAVGADPVMQVWFHVRLYADGRLWVRAVVENGLLDIASPTKNYIPTVIIGGVTVYNNGGASLSHFGNTRWNADGWIGGNPNITPKHNTIYLEASKLIPNYMNQVPSAAALNGLASTYTPMNNADWTQTMGDTGFQNQIGLLPLWDALYATSGADSRAWKAIQNDTMALNSYPIIWNDSATHLPVRPTDRPNWTAEGNFGGGFTALGAGPLTWDVAHHGSGGYLAYIITGDYYFYETLESQAATCYLVNGSAHGAGVNRDPRGDVQDRGCAWCLRTVSQFAAVGPASDTIASDYRTWLGNSATTLNAVPHNNIGLMLTSDISNQSYSSTASVIAPWQRHFFMQTLGMGSDIEPLSNMTNWNALRDFNYGGVVGVLGTVGTTNYCFTEAAQYNIQVADTPSTDTTTWYTDWGTVWLHNQGSSNTSCANTLHGTSGSDPAVASTGYWGNMMPAIAYAKDHSAPGASASWTRLTGATNWNTILNSGFGDTPIFGIIPR